MSYFIHNTKDWPLERLKKYGPELLQALKKIAQKYQNQISLNAIADDIIKGQRQLWLILTEDEKFVAFLTTHLETNLVGKKSLMLLELAGKGGLALAPLIKDIEQYALDCGASEICPIGRIGWTKIMRSLGYRPEIVKFKKELDNGIVFKRSKDRK